MDATGYTSNQKKVTKAAATFGGITFISRVFGFVRDMVIARAFGAEMMADAFFVAFRIPSLLRELFAEGAMSAAFIPVLSKELHDRGHESALRLIRATFTTLLIILICIVSAGVALAPFIVKLIAPGFSAGSKFYLTVNLTRIMFPYLLFISLAALTMGILNTLGIFSIPAMSPIMLSICMIGSVYFLVPRFSTPIYGLAIGVITGGFLQFFIQIPPLWKRKMMPALRFEPSHPGVRQIGKLMLPMMFGLSVTQLNIFVNTILSSFLKEGSISYLYYGIRLIHFPLGIFGVAVATAVLPTLSMCAAKKDYQGIRETYSFAIRLILFITLPAMTGLIVLRVPIVHVLFQGRAFDYTATLGTAEALLFYSVGLWAFAATRVTAQTFYSLQDTKTPVKATTIGVVINIIMSIILMGPLQHGGLALATSLAAMGNLAFLIWNLRRRLGHIGLREIVHSLKTIVFATVCMGFVAWWTSGGNIWGTEGHIYVKIIILAVSIGMSIITYGALLYIWKSQELLFLLRMISEKYHRSGVGPR